MKTKEEIIEEAWGEVYPTIKDSIDEDGWFYRNKHPTPNPFTGFIIPSLEFFGTVLVRPKSISGIGNNNGWIRIESEEDLPEEEYGHCFMVLKGNIVYGGFRRYSKDTFYFFNSAGEGILQSNITHYQLIETPKPPIY